MTDWLCPYPHNACLQGQGSPTESHEPAPGWGVSMKGGDINHVGGFAPEASRVRSSSQATTSVLTIKELEWLLEGFDLWATKPHKTLHYQSVT